MRVLQIVADGAPGGGTTHVLQLLHGLAGYQFALLTQADSYLMGEASRLGVRVFGAEFFRSRCNPLAVRAVDRVLDGYAPDVVHCHGGRAGLFESLTLSRIPAVYTVHGFHFTRRAAMVRWLGSLSERFVIRHAAQVIFVCRHDESLALRGRLVGRGKARCVVYNGVSLAGLPPTAPPPGGGKVGFIGRLEYQKNPGLFLEVMERLPGRQGILVGGGTLEASLQLEVRRRGLEQRVLLVGGLPRERTLEALAQLSVLVMTSRWEGMPILPLEAMAVGIPVVSTRVGGMTEIIDDRVSGILVDEGSAQGLAEAVTELEGRPEFCRDLVTRARERVRSLFSEESMLDAVDAIYQRLGSKLSMPHR